jgi:hypothetical protein
MNAIDTNILAYLFDPDAPEKQSRAQQLASTMTGEALATQTSLTLSFLHNLIRSVLERGDAEAAQGVQEFGARNAGNACRPLLRKQLPFVPFHRRGQPQLASKIVRPFAQGPRASSGTSIVILTMARLLLNHGSSPAATTTCSHVVPGQRCVFC